MVAPGPVPTLTFDSADYSAAQALALWRMSVPYDAFLPAGVDDDGFRARMRAWRVESLLVTAGSQIAMRFVRTPERAAADGRDNLCLMLTLDRGWGGDLDGLEVAVPRGRICLIDFTRPFAVDTPDSRFVMLSVPRQTLLETTGVDHHGRVLDGVSGRLLADHFEALARVLSETSSADLPEVADATLAMVRSCLSNVPRRERSRAALSLRQRIRTYVGAHLTDVELGPDRIAQALAITRSTLYRAFPSAGVVAYIQGRRLEAIRALLDGSGETRSLAEVAEAFGFASHAHLSTAFRRRFGYPPSHARRGTRPAADDRSSAVAAFQDWMVELDASAQANACAGDPPTPR